MIRCIHIEFEEVRKNNILQLIEFRQRRQDEIMKFNKKTKIDSEWEKRIDEMLESKINDFTMQNDVISMNKQLKRISTRRSMMWCSIDQLSHLFEKFHINIHILH